MLRIFAHGTTGSAVHDTVAGGDLPANAVWIDLLSPTREEETFIERALGVAVPTRDEMVEIEPSSRLYIDGEAIVVIANLLAASGEAGPESTAVSFVLTPTHLVTIRYAEPKVFDLFRAHVERSPGLCASATTTLISLLDAIVDRLADALEHVGSEMDGIAKSTFRRGSGRQQRMTGAALQVLLDRIGHAQDLVTKARDSAVSLARLLSFLSFALKKDKNGTQNHLKSLSRDVASLTDHATYLGGNVTFLLDAALGLINIEQNAIIKIFSVAAVIFMPPTLVASVYGMNFAHMPELHLAFGYPMALGIMILSAVMPYMFFKSRGWL